MGAAVSRTEDVVAFSLRSEVAALCVVLFTHSGDFCCSSAQSHYQDFVRRLTLVFMHTR